MINLYNNGLPNCIEVKNSALSSLNDIFKLMFGHLCIGNPGRLPPGLCFHAAFRHVYCPDTSSGALSRME